MYQIREVFQAKPGKAKDLVKMFKQAAPHFEKTQGVQRVNVLTDIVSTYWTVVVEMETEDIGDFFTNLRSATMSDELKDIMKGYMDCVEGGKREIFMIE
jgi:heme-degrading monooxygenase HmoA